MAGRTIIQHYHTTGTTAPVASNLEYGEIAVGAGSTNTHLYIKDDTGALRTFSPAATNTITAGSGKYFTSLTQVDGKLVSGATANLPSGDGGGAYLPLSGGTVDGGLTVSGCLVVDEDITASYVEANEFCATAVINVDYAIYDCGDLYVDGYTSFGSDVEMYGPVWVENEMTVYDKPFNIEASGADSKSQLIFKNNQATNDGAMSSEFASIKGVYEGVDDSWTDEYVPYGKIEFYVTNSDGFGADAVLEQGEFRVGGVALGSNTKLSNLTVSGATTFNGTINAKGALTVNNNLTVTGTTTLSTGGTVYTGNVNIASGSHVFFNRADWNYISLPDSDYAALAICRGIAGGSNAQYLLSHDSFRPANDNTKTIGTSSYRWNNIYSKGADIDGNIHVKRSSTGGTIFFGDMDSDDEGYVYIREKSSDRLEIAADSGILLHTGCVNEGDDIVLRIWHPDRNGALRPDTFSSTNTNTMSIDLGTDSQRFYDGYFSNKIYAANGFYQSSDERLKTFGDDLKIDLDALSKCRKSYFTFNENTEEKHIGVSAQEIQKLYPEVVTETIEGYLNVDYAKLSVVALAAVDKLHEEVSELKELVKQLMNK